MIPICGQSSMQDFDIGAAERAAYQRGEIQLAELLGRLMDAEESKDEDLKAAEEEAEEQRGIATAAEESLVELRQKFTLKLDELHGMVKGAKPLKRSQLLEFIEQAGKELEL